MRNSLLYSALSTTTIDWTLTLNAMGPTIDWTLTLNLILTLLNQLQLPTLAFTDTPLSFPRFCNAFVAPDFGQT